MKTITKKSNIPVEVCLEQYQAQILEKTGAELGELVTRVQHKWRLACQHGQSSPVVRVTDRGHEQAEPIAEPDCPFSIELDETDAVRMLAHCYAGVNQAGCAHLQERLARHVNTAIMDTVPRGLS